ncbi:hypothetical protein EZE20_19600 [Arundinibacter roseus]|uniref:Uncharacterized protein n=1 Tax=Arundinibacter roseus TaxID=2070510 RepID=A0A4R4K4M6_9BACT|nr:hypothetical protein EZE20_19600 [Arundinibacter roseus]
MAKPRRATKCGHVRCQEINCFMKIKKLLDQNESCRGRPRRFTCTLNFD